ncbi:protein MpCCAAT-NFYC3 [Marchantia polymorpha subsp. ruderalis]|uniref:Transcription factor CBF/NF-Y/archaeal histone domain-containing protein n=2 Tax=Marchantia polymorpha TaxID=3197 RepID=A0A176VIQ0_MARPO|nr:hypothetical protein AXG93_203s1180 [Marchantia polymorpha subsp. ruderalis]PTQ28281.1 hypothetical protein MARPO_0168s0007 [Marchantia polymorpha]BBN03660.1 hypothetical protein Mp_2g25260 [Marchantia polymorpha subsp. ruderalis]|eukprot:PTQ28281.1 hypothetical protein MARPO_0168s0007 [Marchantia polymorpha]
MSSSDESDSGRRSSDAEEDEKMDEEKEEVDSQSQDDSPSPSPVRSQTHSARSKSASLNALAFPISRVRRLVKSEGDMQWVGVEAGFLIAKAAELFLEKFVEEAFEKMTEEDRTTLHYKDLAEHVTCAERMDFLADFVPEMVLASTATSAKAMADR